MMKHLLRLSLGAAALLLSSACARHKIIPDDRLALIFHDAFLANAYVGAENIKLDSLNLYEPIFEAYGCTTEDVQYTIGNFSKRKSARLGDVVEQAITRLEAEGKYYDREVAILDTIDRVALRTFTRKVHTDTLIRVAALADTARLSFVFDAQPGEYEINLTYRIDSLDRNEKDLTARLWLELEDGTRATTQTITLRRDREERLNRRMTADSSHCRLHVDLLNFNAPPRRPSMTVRDLTVEYKPKPHAAVEMLYDRQMDIRIFAEEFFGGLRRTTDTLSTHGAPSKDSL